MRIHLAQQAEPHDPWLAEITAYVLVENNGVAKQDTVIQITGGITSGAVICVT
jgi:hypothetical protein